MARSSLRKVYGVAFLTSRWIKRQPTWLLQGVLSSAGFAVSLYAWRGTAGLKNIIVAWIISWLWGAGVNIVAQEVGWHRATYLHDMFVASPVRPVHYPLGVLPPP